MSLRKVLAWLFVLAVAAGAYFYTAERAERVSLEQRTASKVLSLDDPLNVQVVELSGEDYPRPVRIERRDQEHKWQMVKPVDWQADGVRVGRLLDTLLGAHWQRRLQGQKNLADFGLKPPRVRVRLTGRKGETAELLVGDRSPSGEYFYAAPPDSRGEVWLLPGKDRFQISLTLFDLRDKAVLDFVVADVERIELKRKQGGDLVLERKKAGPKPEWRFAGGERASAEEVEDWLFQIHGMRVADFVDSGIDPKRMGLAQPRMRLVLGLAGGGRAGMVVGGRAKTGDESYVRRLAGGPVLVVKDNTLQRLRKSRKDLAYRKVWELDRERVLALTVKAPGRKDQVYVKEGGQWKRRPDGGGEAVDSALDLLLWDLKELKFEKILPAKGDYGLEEPRWTIEIKQQDKDKPEQARAYTLLIGKKDAQSGLLAVQVKGDRRIFGVKPELLNSIPKGDDQKPRQGR